MLMLLCFDYGVIGYARVFVCMCIGVGGGGARGQYQVCSLVIIHLSF